MTIAGFIPHNVRDMRYDAEALLIVADRYGAATKRGRARVSTLAANDGKTLDHVARGGGITIGRYNRIMRWFSANWPHGLEWPEGVERPPAEEKAA